MSYKNLYECIKDLEKTKQLVQINQEIDPYLEAGAIQRRVYQQKGPALLFTRVKGSRFPMVANLFGTMERARYLFRDSLKNVKTLIDLKVDPQDFFKKPFRLFKIPCIAFHLKPKKVGRALVLKCQTTIGELPQLVSWSKDGGAFITLPQVYTEDVEKPGWRYSNLGMYRIQLSGGEYQKDKEVGLHYQTHRGIGVHHEKAKRLEKPFRVNIFVGGPPAMTLAAVMPLPEGLPELSFAGVLGGRRIPLIYPDGQLPIHAEADFCITGIVHPIKLLPEGPFGDHLGYYSLQHDYPVLQVEKVYHRPNAIWPFTTVGRPPQEDTIFGELIHEITGPIIPTIIPGVHQVHAVDATGVHPLLLAIGSERYTPYLKNQRPQELLTQANAILGQGQLSLAKYLLISNHADNPNLRINDIGAFIQHTLERVDWKRDLHFQTCTTIDTLDYSGEALNQGSKLVIAAIGPLKRKLSQDLPNNLKLPNGFKNPRVVIPGVLVVEGKSNAKVFCESLTEKDSMNQFPLIVIVDDSDFVSRSLGNFLWVTFTRSNPAVDIDGIESFVDSKHWGCKGSLVIDARIKPHHAPPLEEDPEIEKRVDSIMNDFPKF